MEGLRGQGWLLSPSGSSGTTGLTTLPHPSVEEALAAYVGFVAWVPSKKALATSPDAAWLLPLLADLCSCLAASPAIGARWALRMPEGDAGSSLVFAARACAVHGQHLPAADLLRAYLRYVSREVRVSEDITLQGLPHLLAEAQALAQTRAQVQIGMYCLHCS